MDLMDAFADSNDSFQQSRSQYKPMDGLTLSQTDIDSALNKHVIDEKEHDVCQKAVKGQGMSPAQVSWVLRIQKRVTTPPVECTECKQMVYVRTGKDSGKDYYRCDNKDGHSNKDIKWVYPFKKQWSNSQPSGTASAAGTTVAYGGSYNK